MQQISDVTHDPSPHQLISARTLFSVRPTDPPSSPPPTSPLPPLPEIAPHRASRNSSTRSSTPKYGRPTRPPRPVNSQPNLQPRMIRSPDYVRRERRPVADQTLCSPPSSGRSLGTGRVHNGEQSPSEHRNSMRLLTPTPQSASSFSNDILAALPRFFQRSQSECLNSPVELLPNNFSGPRQEKVRPWQVYHRSSSKSPAGQAFHRIELRKPVARSALFIPPSPLEQTYRSNGKTDPANPAALTYSRAQPNICQKALHTASRSSLFSTRRSPNNASSQSRSNSNFASEDIKPHKRLQGITASKFDFNDYQGQSAGQTSLSPSENLTSLPRIPSAPTVNTIDIPERQRLKSPIHFQSPFNRDATETSPHDTAFVSVPYSTTRGANRLLPGTDRGRLPPHAEGTGIANAPANQSHVRSRAILAEMSEQEAHPVLTEEAITKMKRRRLLWAIATVCLLIIATGGILTGILWKLRTIG